MVVAVVQVDAAREAFWAQGLVSCQSQDLSGDPAQVVNCVAAWKADGARETAWVAVTEIASVLFDARFRFDARFTVIIAILANLIKIAIWSVSYWNRYG